MKVIGCLTVIGSDLSLYLTDFLAIFMRVIVSYTVWHSCASLSWYVMFYFLLRLCVCCFLSTVNCLLTLMSIVILCIVSTVFCVLSPVYFLLCPFFCLRSLFFCLLSLFSVLLSHVNCHKDDWLSDSMTFWLYRQNVKFAKWKTFTAHVMVQNLLKNSTFSFWFNKEKELSFEIRDCLKDICFVLGKYLKFVLNLIYIRIVCVFFEIVTFISVEPISFHSAKMHFKTKVQQLIFV